MTRSMYDSVSANSIPVTVDMVAGYVNGHYAWTQNDWDRFPHSAHVTIDVFGDRPDADVLDVETGDATPDQAVTWVRAKKAQGHPYPPVIYCNRSTLTPVFNAMNAAGFQIERDFRTWVATLDGTQHLGDMTGVTAIQYLNTSGWDESIVYDDAWKAPAPAPVPVPPPVVTIHGVVVELPGGVTHPVSSTDAGKTWH